MSDTYSKEIFPFKKDDVLKITLYYSVKAVKTNDILYNRDLSRYLKLLKTMLNFYYKSY